MPLDKSVLMAFVAPAASTTDAPVVAAVPGQRIRVVAFAINHGDTTASTVTFNTKPTGAGSAISPALKGAANGFLHAGGAGWFQTNTGEGLSVSTGAGSATGIMVGYHLVAG